MKLFHKIFLCFMLIFGITFQTAGFLLIDFASRNAISQEKKYAFQDFQYNKYILQSILYSEPDFFEKEETELAGISSNFTVPIAVYGIDGEYLFSNIAMQPWELDVHEEDYDRISFRICEKAGESYIFVYYYVRQDENSMYLITQTDISSVIDAQKSMMVYFQKLYIVLLFISFPVIFLLTKVITASIKKVGKC